jgi:hypothetical protein
MGVSLNHDAGSYTRFVGVCGAVATVEGALVYPFDLVKTRQQASSPSSSAMHRSTLRYLNHVVRTDGVRSLYRGFGWSVIGGMPSEVSYYLTYTVLKDGMLQTRFGKEHPTAVYLAAGALADATSLVLWVPADLISQRLQVQGVLTAYGDRASTARGVAPPMSGWQLVGHVLEREGVSGLWRGLGATIALHAPASAVWWLAYEEAKSALGRWSGRSSDSSVLVQAQAGALAGAVSAAVTTPIDVLKTRIQVEPAERALVAHFADVVREAGGPRGLFRGFLPRVVASMPRSVISLVGYEYALKLARCDGVGGGDANR